MSDQYSHGQDNKINSNYFRNDRDSRTEHGGTTPLPSSSPIENDIQKQRANSPVEICDQQANSLIEVAHATNDPIIVMGPPSPTPGKIPKGRGNGRRVPRAIHAVEEQFRK